MQIFPTLILALSSLLLSDNARAETLEGGLRGSNQGDRKLDPAVLPFWEEGKECSICGANAECKKSINTYTGSTSVIECRCIDGYYNRGGTQPAQWQGCKLPCEHANCASIDQCVADGLDSYCENEDVVIQSNTNEFDGDKNMEKGDTINLDSVSVEGTTIGDIKATIKARNDIEIRKQKIKYNGEWRSNDSTLQSIGFPIHGRTLYLGKK